MTDTTTALRALTQHLERHQLDDGIIRASIVHDEIDVQLYVSQGDDLRSLLARWAASIHDAAITAKPVDAAFHVHLRGTLGEYRATVACVVSGERADQIRAVLGLPTVPALPTGDALLDALTATAAA